MSLEYSATAPAGAKDPMAINWFPGHMLTARKEALETMSRTDVVIEVLDARVPHSSLNPMIEELRRKNQRPALRLLNKADAADPARTAEWLAHLESQPGVKAVAISARNPGEVGKIPAWCLALAPHRTTKLKPLRMMILGIPNVGKSTLMNALLRRSVARVGDEPAITKTQMRHELSPTMSIIDTPGMMWAGMSQATAYKLAQTHSIGRNAYEDEEAAVALGAYLLADYPVNVSTRYGEPPAGCDGHGLVAWVTRARGMLVKGGEPDLAKAATTLLTDFRSGALGRITLESVAQVEARLAEEAAARKKKR